MSAALKRYAPLAALLLMVGATYAFGLHHYLTLDALRDNRQILQAFVADHLLAAAFAYAVLYTAVVALSLPGAAVMTLGGGFLFGTGLGGVFAIWGATMGAVLVFLIAKSIVGDALRRRAGPFLRRMEDGFRTNAFNYLLFLRLVPAFPFWAVNLVPAMAGVSLRVFITATVIGTIPGTFVFAAFGAGLGDVFDTGEKIQLANILSPTLLAAFAGLGLLALLPIFLKKRHRP